MHVGGAECSRRPVAPKAWCSSRASIGWVDQMDETGGSVEILRRYSIGSRAGGEMDGARESKPAASELQILEIRHRLANCFQLLTGLIQFRITHTPDGESKRQLTGLQDAVASLGLLQQRLAAAGSAGFQAYLAEAADLWRHLTADRGINIALEAEDIEIAADKATALALILHELMTNCCEHAFPNERGGNIQISLSSITNGFCALQVLDDGVGLPAERRALPSFGFSVVDRLASQLGGSFAVEDNSPGTKVRIEFPLHM
jgi:two-component sensor histidine kinase